MRLLVVSRRLTESPYKVVLEHLEGLEPPGVKTAEEDEEDEESQVVLQRPLEICLKHSTVSTDASACPLVRPQPGVAALHEYAEWIMELNDKQGDAERK